MTNAGFLSCCISREDTKRPSDLDSEEEYFSAEEDVAPETLKEVRQHHWRHLVRRDDGLAILSKPSAEQVVSKSKPLPYHPLSDLCGAPGYIGSLSSSEEEKLLKLQLAASQSVGDLSPFLIPGETEEQFLLRFMRARGFNVQKALAMLTEDVRWRRETDVATLRSVPAEHVLGCNPAVVHRYIPSKHLGFDKQGRPIVAKHFGYKTVIADLLKSVSLESLVRYHVWQNESYCQMLAEQSKRLGQSVEQFVFIIDAKGWHPGLASRAAFAFIRRMVEVDDKHYPERLGMLIVANAPVSLAFAWRIIRSWLGERTKEKFHFCSSASEVAGALLSHIDADQLPKEYGGTAPPVGLST